MIMAPSEEPTSRNVSLPQCCIADVAIAALRTLLRGVAFLEGEDLQAVLLRCAQCNMTGEVSSVAARTVANGTGASPETTALVAALVDDSNLARKALHSSGTRHTFSCLHD